MNDPALDQELLKQLEKKWENWTPPVNEIRVIDIERCDKCTVGVGTSQRVTIVKGIEKLEKIRHQESKFFKLKNLKVCNRCYKKYKGAK